MQTFRTKTIISQDGKLSIQGLPFHKGEKVEVIIQAQPQADDQERYPLRGKPVFYHQPFDSIAEDDWNLLK